MTGTFDIMALALGGLGALDLTPGVTFANDDALKDFVGGLPAGAMRDSPAPWQGITAATLSTLRQRVTELDTSMNPAGMLALESFRGRAQSYANQLDGLQRFGLFGRSPEQDAQYRQTMSLLKQEILGFLNAPVLAMQPPVQPPAQSLPVQVEVVTQDDSSDAGRTLYDFLAEMGVQRAPVWLWVGGGVVAVVLLGLVLTRGRP